MKMKDCLVLIFNILSAVTAHAQEITGNIGRAYC